MLDTKAFKVLIAVLAVALTTSCSDEGKGPPDDDDFRSLVSKTNASCDEASFYDCAVNVLSGSSLSSDEKESLSGCDFDLAAAKTSSPDVFEVSKQAVKQSCE
ncbi:MAG: hypothetical protein V4692_05005 [Bdellovibrionota bacterium]